MALKEKLLKTGYFIDNEYLANYIKLVENYTTDKLYTEKHHILQRAYFELNGLEVDNSKANIVKLAYADHCKAHWLLYWCTKSVLRNANAWTIQYLQASYKKYTGNNKRKFEFNQVDFELLESYWLAIKDDADNLFWIDEDLETLKLYYSDIGAEGVQKKLKYPRSIQAIRLQASLLKLTSPIYWTEEEIEKLKKYYPLEGYFCYKRFKNKTKGAIQSKAFRLKLPSSIDWTDNEIALLKKYYPLYGYKCYKYLHRKSIASIKAKAKEFGLLNPYASKWTAADIEILKNNYANLGTACQSLMSNKYTYNEIYKKAQDLNLFKAGWTAEEINILIKYYPIEKSKIKNRLPRHSIEAIYSKVRDLRKTGALR